MKFLAEVSLPSQRMKPKFGLMYLNKTDLEKVEKKLVIRIFYLLLATHFPSLYLSVQSLQTGFQR